MEVEPPQQVEIKLPLPIEKVKEVVNIEIPKVQQIYEVIDLLSDNEEPKERTNKAPEEETKEPKVTDDKRVFKVAKPKINKSKDDDDEIEFVGFVSPGSSKWPRNERGRFVKLESQNQN